MYAIDRQADVRRQTKASLNAPRVLGMGHKKPFVWRLLVMLSLVAWLDM